MHVLVTGGTGLVGKSAVDHLLARGHTVRLFAIDATDVAAEWPEGVEPRDGDVGSDKSVQGVAEGCDAVLHVIGIVAEDPPKLTFDAINVEGTRRIVHEAEAAGVRRFVYVSSLGADTGESDYHRSKLAGEEIARQFRGSWTICRPGNVYGPGDEVISLMLKIVRASPVIPVMGDGEQEFQPIWVEDLGEALAVAVEREDLGGQLLELAGTERTTTNDLVDRFAQITGTSPRRLPIPEWLAGAGAKSAEALGVSLPIKADQITMLQEGNVISGQNALTEVLGVTPTPLADGLRKLADDLPEMLLAEGVGRLHRERFWADIQGSRLTPEEILLLVREHFRSLPPEGLLEVGAEPQTPTTLEEGGTLTLAVPMRGHVQVRVQEVTSRAITSVTLEGHFFAGVIRFLTEEPDRGVIRFEVRAYTRAADQIHRLAIRTVGKVAQQETWTTVVEEVVQRSGGNAPDGVHTEDEVVSEQEAREVEAWSEALVTERKREEAPTPG
jgi:NADH dehydrogenase